MLRDELHDDPGPALVLRLRPDTPNSDEAFSKVRHNPCSSDGWVNHWIIFVDPVDRSVFLAEIAHIIVCSVRESQGSFEARRQTKGGRWNPLTSFEAVSLGVQPSS